MLILFNHQLREDNDRVAELAVDVDARFITTINTFVVQNVFQVSQEEFDRLDQQSQIELTCKRRCVLGEYCKLVVNGILAIIDMSLVLRYYLKDYADYGDILKGLIARTKELDHLATARALVLALINVYEDLKGEFEAEVGT